MAEQKKDRKESIMSNAVGQQTPDVNRGGSKGQTITQSEKQPTKL